MDVYTDIAIHSQLSDDEPNVPLSHLEELSSDDESKQMPVDTELEGILSHSDSSESKDVNLSRTELESHSNKEGSAENQSDQSQDRGSGAIEDEVQGTPHIEAYQGVEEDSESEQNPGVDQIEVIEQNLESDQENSGSESDVSHSEEYPLRVAEHSHLEVRSQQDHDENEPEVVQSQTPESDALQVIELDSEDEIENLEAFADDPKQGEDDNNFYEEDEIQSHEEVEYSDEEGDLQDGQDDLHEEFSEQHESNDAIIDPETSLWLENPLVISVTGDRLLLIPHFKDPSVKDMISLFSVEEVAACTLSGVFQLLRNGDLIDAYSFDPADELKISIPQLNLSFSEDNIHTREVKFLDLVQVFNQLSASTALTLYLTTQKRFISQFKIVTQLRDSGKSLEDICRERDSEREIDSERESEIPKKRRFS